jgi:hypothetical protein
METLVQNLQNDYQQMPVGDEKNNLRTSRGLGTPIFVGCDGGLIQTRFRIIVLFKLLGCQWERVRNSK